MKTIFGKLSRFVLGVNKKELENKQMRYLKSVAKKNKTKLNTRNLYSFIDTIKNKHLLKEISVFSKETTVFTSNNKSKDAYDFFTIFTKSKPFMRDNIMMLKDKNWKIIFEKNDFVFVVERDSKPSEFELDALSTDVLKHIDKIFVEEKKVYEKIYNKIENWV